MLITKKMLLALTLVGALVGAGVGALITHSASGNTEAANTTTATTPAYNNAQTAQTNPVPRTPEEIAAANASQFKTSEEQTAYRQGFDDGLNGCTTAANETSSRTVAYNNAPVRRYSNGRRVYYDYGNAPRGRTFWQKHRDKLTLAMGTGGGALLGGLIGGKRGAGIGALAGLGGSALYTYKLRHRRHRY
jgi:hypothetical protein